MLPELYAMWIVFHKYSRMNRTFKEVGVGLYKPYAQTKDLPADWSLERMIESWPPPQDDFDHELTLSAIARDFFTPEEAAEVERVFAEDPPPDATLYKERMEWPVPRNLCPRDFGGHSVWSVDLEVTDKVYGYAYSLHDFETL